MVLHALNIDGIDHSIYMRTASKKAYHGLLSALLANISDADQTKITNTDINDRNIIYYTDIVNCFAGIKHLTSKEMNSCICGKIEVLIGVALCTYNRTYSLPARTVFLQHHTIPHL
jgi:hypothetical protein